MPSPPSNSSPIIIVGAGVFGLSTALHLSRAGYTNITVFDRQPYHQNAYSTSAGADAASADMNKVMRLSYGTQILYQQLAFDGLAVWNEWNEQIAASRPEELPKGLKPSDKIWNNCGFLRLSRDPGLSQHELDTLENLTKEGLRKSQYVIGDAEDEKRAKEKGLQGKFDPFGLRERRVPLVGVFDSLGGFTEASKACTWVLHLLSKAGVNLQLGPEKGTITEFLKSPAGKTVGVKTQDGESHKAALVIVACGPWTPTVLPRTSTMLEATGGSVAYIQLPPRDQFPDLWDRYSPEKLPVYTWGGWGNGRGLGGFPRTEDGVMKFGYRGTKYTNFETGGKDVDVSTPKTAYWPQREDPAIVKTALDALKGMIRDLFPDLVQFGISGVRNCWYTDSLDNSFIVDRDPEEENLIVCSGGSGHGFKFLPILGREVVRIIEEPERKNEYGEMWRWRTGDQGLRNGLEEGKEGPRVLKKQKMATKEDWKFREAAKL